MVPGNRSAVRGEVIELGIAFLESGHAAGKLSFQDSGKSGMHHAIARLRDEDNGDRLRSVIACPGSDQGQVLAVQFCERISFDLVATQPPILATLAQPARLPDYDVTVRTNAAKVRTTRIESFLRQKAPCDFRVDVERTLFACCCCAVSREQSEVRFHERTNNNDLGSGVNSCHTLSPGHSDLSGRGCQSGSDLRKNLSTNRLGQQRWHRIADLPECWIHRATEHEAIRE